MVCIFLLLGGCQMNEGNADVSQGQDEPSPMDMSPEELPQVRAFQDEYTRQFMVSTEEVQEGYYLMRSELNAFTMLFPANGGIAPNFHSVDGDHYEIIIFGARAEEENVSYSVDIKYHEKSSDIILRNFRNRLGYEGEYEEFELQDKKIYMGKQKRDYEGSTVYMYFSYIKSKITNQGLDFYFDVSCSDQNKPCDINLEKEEKRAIMFMESVNFLPQEEGD